MRKLYLMRHADAPMAYDMLDKDRPLSPHGIDQTKSIAPHLEPIDHVLCSSATRTKMTCEALIESGAKIGKIDYLDDLYNAPAGVLLENLQSALSQNIMIIAHNPGIHALANMLVKDEANNTQIEQLRLFYNPATLSIFKCITDDWKNIEVGENQLSNLIIPD